ncbi:MAG: hypothetical protein M3167_06205 [Acidobacteriota bacterium]|nr:hypothetical protein [Acidobacteriota bacterium]MDQ6892257.1 hypothetical protein [Acidobacteriota bacterium]
MKEVEIRCTRPECGAVLSTALEEILHAEEHAEEDARETKPQPEEPCSPKTSTLIL